MKISFNKKEIKKMSKKEFLKKFSKYSKYIDLDTYFDSLKTVKVAKRKTK